MPLRISTIEIDYKMELDYKAICGLHAAQVLK